jgi:hypothetical protein
MNALRHGLTARRASLALGESREEYDELEGSLRDVIAPEGGREETLFQDFVDRLWRLRRVTRLEAQLFSLFVARSRASEARSEVAAHERHEGGLFQDFVGLEGTVRITDETLHAAATKRVAAAEALIASEELAEARMFESRNNSDQLLKLARYERHLYNTMCRSYEDLRAEQDRRAGEVRQLPPAIQE